MRVRVLMFGALADALRREDDFDVDGSTAEDVVAAVRTRHPEVAELLERCSVAVNQEVVPRSHVVSADDEFALLPPSSGGAVHIALTDAPSVDSALAAVRDPSSGGTVVFVGSVRDSSDVGPVEELDYSAYRGMAEKVMSEIAAEAIEKWGLSGVAIEHSVGVRAAGDITFVVVCAAAHRDEAFDACRYVVDETKRRVPIWKKERGPWGERWL
jgi:molybdopterin synthase catalytic subunit/molybdopterin converting factor small subunit